MLHPIVPLRLQINIRTMHPNNLGRKITDTNPFLTTRFTITDKHEIRCPGNLPGRQNIPPIRHRNGHNIRIVTLLPRNRRTRRHTIRRNTTTRQTKNHNNYDSYTPPEIKHSSPPQIQSPPTSPQSQHHHPTNESHQESTIHIRGPRRGTPETRRNINPSNSIKSRNQFRSNHQSIRRRTQLKIPQTLIITPHFPPLNRIRHTLIPLTRKRSTRSQLPVQIPRTKELNIWIPSSALPNNPFINMRFNIDCFIARFKECNSDALFHIPWMSKPNNTRYRTNNPLRRVIKLPPIRRLNNHSGTPPLHRSRSRSSRIRHRPHKRTPTNTTRHKRNSNQPQHNPPTPHDHPSSHTTRGKILYRTRHKTFHNLDRTFPHDIRRHTRPSEDPSSRFSHAGRRLGRRRDGSHRIRRSRRTRRTNERNSIQSTNQLRRNHRSVRKTFHINTPLPVFTPQHPALSGDNATITISNHRGVSPGLRATNHSGLQSPDTTCIISLQQTGHHLISLELHIIIRPMRILHIRWKIMNLNTLNRRQTMTTGYHQTTRIIHFPRIQKNPPIRHRYGHSIRNFAFNPRGTGIRSTTSTS